MDFAKSNIRISLSLSPGEPLIIDDRLLHVKTLKILFAVTREFVSVAFAIPYHQNIPMDKYIHLSFLLLFPVDLVIGRYPEILSIDPRILCAYCLAVPFHRNTPTDNFSPLSSIHSSPVVHVFHNGLWNTIRSSKNSSVAYCSAILVCLHYGCFPYVWQYSLVSLGMIILILLIQHVCECTQSSVDPFKLSFRLRRHFKRELVLNQSNCHRLYP